MLHADELRQKAATLLGIAEAVDHPSRHIVNGDIGRGRDAAGGELLEDHRGIAALQARAADILAHIDAGKAERRRLAQRLDGENTRLVPVAGIRAELARREVPRHLLYRPLVLGKLEIHSALSPATPGMITVLGAAFNAPAMMPPAEPR